MPSMQNAYTADMMMQNRNGQPMDWSSEISAQPMQGRGTADPAAMGGNLQMQHGQPSEVIEAPLNLQEAYLGSLKSMLNRNRGNYIVATFLVGTQNTVSWEGILYEVGNDFITIYQPARDRYIVTDMYSLKYIEFYDTRRQGGYNMNMPGGNNWQQNG